MISDTIYRCYVSHVQQIRLVHVLMSREIKLILNVIEIRL